MKILKKKAIISFIVCACMFITTPEANACSRALYVGDNDLVVTGRSQDWFEELQTDLWVFPQGMERNGEVGPKSISWTSKYGSLSASLYGMGVGEGVNEKGLAVHLLYLAESDYGNSTDRPRLSMGAWAQYVLDNYATVTEAVKDLGKDNIQIIAPKAPSGHDSTVHIAISDSTGDSTILEYIKGKLVIHHGKEFKVMTNSPTFDEQLALNSYWKEIGGAVMLPGTHRAADRFARADYYINALPKTSDSREAVASVMSVIRNISVPRGFKDPSLPNISSTIWRSVFDHKNKVYYYEGTYTPNVFWVTLGNLNFKKGAPVMKLKLENGDRILTGDASDKFEKAKPFKFITDQK